MAISIDVDCMERTAGSGRAAANNVVFHHPSTTSDLNCLCLPIVLVELLAGTECLNVSSKVREKGCQENTCREAASFGNLRKKENDFQRVEVQGEQLTKRQTLLMK